MESVVDVHNDNMKVHMASDNPVFKLVLLERGNGIMKVGDSTFAFNAPVAFCFNENEQPEFVEKKDVCGKVICFVPSVINSSFNFENIRSIPESFSITELQDTYWLKPFLERNSRYFGKMTIGPVTSKRICNLINGYAKEVDEKGQYWTCRGRSFLIEILVMIYRIFDEPREEEDFCLCQLTEDMAPVIMYLQNNYASKITIEQLTREFGINRTTLASKFNEVTGMTVVTYLNRLRINTAAAMLRDTLLPVTEIMEQVGFNESSHFCRTFHKYAGCSPSEYRERFCWAMVPR